jgi:hypothetical protein
VDGSKRISLGILKLDGNGKGELKFKEDKGLNLVSLYNTVEVTIEPNPDPDPKSSGSIAYSFTLPKEGLTHVRYLLASSPDAPNQIALIQGLFDDVKTINELASQMQKASDNNNRAHVLLNAEAMQNIIVGAQSPNHKDLDNDGQVDDPSDGFGLQLNGRNLGYLQAVYREADATVTSPEASEPMVTYGNGLKNSVQNLAGWLPQTQDLLTAILNAPPGADIKQQVAQVVVLTNQLLKGIDLDHNGKVDAALGEAGAQTAYDQAYQMADMPLDPVGIINIGTGTPSFIVLPPTKAGEGGGGSGNLVATPKPGNTPPGQVKTPKPHPTNKNNGGSNNKNGNNP